MFLVQVVFSQTSDLAEQPPMESLPSSSKESMTSENLYQTFVSKHFDFLNEEDSIHEMFPIITNAPDFGDEDDGTMTSFDDAQLPADNEVEEKISFRGTILLRRRIEKRAVSMIDIAFSRDRRCPIDFEVSLP